MDMPVVWTIAGSDSGGGAGIQADLKVMNAFGVHGNCIITALTAQNRLGIQCSESVSEYMLRAQIQALEEDTPPMAVKIGMLGNAAACEVLASFCSTLKAPIVCDPVLQSTSGFKLLSPESLDILIHKIFPVTEILTPNLPEAETLIGRPFCSLEEAAKRILETGSQSVLITGGHAEDGECRDYWTDGIRSIWLSSPRIETRATHGTGCVISSAIASAIALGQTVPDAIISAKTFLNQCLKRSTHTGKGHGPIMIEPFLNDSTNRPDIF